MLPLYSNSAASSRLRASSLQYSERGPRSWSYLALASASEQLRRSRQAALAADVERELRLICCETLLARECT